MPPLSPPCVPPNSSLHDLPAKRKSLAVNAFFRIVIRLGDELRNRFRYFLFRPIVDTEILDYKKVTGRLEKNADPRNC